MISFCLTSSLEFAARPAPVSVAELVSLGRSTHYAILDHQVDNWQRHLFPARRNHVCRFFVVLRKAGGRVLVLDVSGRDRSARAGPNFDRQMAGCLGLRTLAAFAG